jgi:hypothetical protein
MSWVKEGTGSYFSQVGWGGNGVEDRCTPIGLWFMKSGQYTLLKKLVKFGNDRAQSHIYMTNGFLILWLNSKYSRISSHIRKPFLFHMTVNLIPSEFPSIWGKFSNFFYRCIAPALSNRDENYPHSWNNTGVVGRGGGSISVWHMPVPVKRRGSITLGQHAEHLEERHAWYVHLDECNWLIQMVPKLISPKHSSVAKICHNLQHIWRKHTLSATYVSRDHGPNNDKDTKP